MKKKYIAPNLVQIAFRSETGILATSDTGHRFDVGMSKEAMEGSQSLSGKKHSIWNTEDTWK